MPSLEAYSRDLPYSYALGLFPASELMHKRPELARRLLVASRAEDSEGLRALRALCAGKTPTARLAAYQARRIALPPWCLISLRARSILKGATWRCTIPATRGTWAPCCARRWAWLRTLRCLAY